ncbi:MAG: carbon-nitrogen hydrolase family protein [Candidatus Glassbacteria bacterium]
MYWKTALVWALILVPALNAADFSARPFTASCAQIFVTDDVSKNLDKYLHFIQRADSLGVELLVFPEASLSGYGPEHYKDKPMPLQDTLTAALDRVREAARQAGLWVLVGTSTWRDGGLFNEVHLLDDQGEIRATYAKTQLTSGDATQYKPGEKITAFEAGGMKFGLQICYDIRFPEPWRILALEGAQVIIHAAQACGSSSWKIPVWEGHLRSRAAENGVWVVSCNAAGPVQMGRSYIVDPDGLLVAQSNQDSEELIYGLVDLSRKNRVNISSRRIDLYQLLPADRSAP